MKKILLSSFFQLLVIASIQCKQADEQTRTHVNNEQTLNAEITKRSLQTDIDNLFTYIQNGQSSYAKSIIQKYKYDEPGMRQLLTAQKNINGINGTTPLHLASKKNDEAVVVYIFVRQGTVTQSPGYQSFGHELAAMKDAANRKPIDYITTVPQLLNAFATP